MTLETLSRVSAHSRSASGDDAGFAGDVHTGFYLGTDLHAPAALLYFGLAPFTQWVYGTGQILAALAFGCWIPVLTFGQYRRDARDRTEPAS